MVNVEFCGPHRRRVSFKATRTPQTPPMTQNPNDWVRVINSITWFGDAAFSAFEFCRPEKHSIRQAVAILLHYTQPCSRLSVYDERISYNGLLKPTPTDHYFDFCP